MVTATQDMKFPLLRVDNILEVKGAPLKKVITQKWKDILSFLGFVYRGALLIE